jgi:hypothetical protein
MAERRKSRKSQRPLRRAFRWCRIALLLLVALITALFLWANIFGLPRWVSAEIQKELQRRGIHLEFARLRLRGFRHIVARDVRVESADTTNSPNLTVREAEFLIDYQQLKSGNLTLAGVRVVSGTLRLPVEPRNARALTISNITADVLLLPGDTLQVANLSAETLGARATLSGEVKRFSRFKLAGAGQPGRAMDWQGPLRQVLDIAEELHFERAPELSIFVLADGADVSGARATVTLRSSEAASRWGRFDHLEVSSSVGPDETNKAVRGTFYSTLTAFRTDFGGLGSLKIEGETRWSRNMDLLLTNSVQISAQNIDSKWFRSIQVDAALASSQASTNSAIRSTVAVSTEAIEAPGVAARTNSLRAELEHPLPFSTPAVWLAHLFSGKALEPPAGRVGNLISGTWRADSSRVKTSRVDLDSIRLNGALTFTTNRNSDRQLGAWRFLAGLQTPWQAQITNIHAGDIAIGSLTAEGRWEFPRLDLKGLDARLHGGYLKAAGGLDVNTRNVSGNVEAKFHYDKAAVILDKPVQAWIAQFGWEEPPLVESTVLLRFPPWTNWTAQFRHEITTSLELAGKFDGRGRFRELAVDQARSDFSFSNFVWRLPNLEVRRPEGDARIDYWGNVTNADFRCSIESRLDPGALKQILPKEDQAALGMVKFAVPPSIKAELHGNWDDDAKLRVQASIAATNFFVKEQAFSDVAGGVLITNGIIYCTNVIAHRGKEETRAPYLQIDLGREVMFVTNLVSTIDPWIAMSLVGEDAYNAIDPYRFAKTPTVGVNGIVPLRHWSKADLHFDVAGDEFTFWRFHLPTLAGHVHWRSNEVSFSNVVANFYGGKARWSGRFVIDPRKGEDYAIYSFAGYTTNTELKYLVADITGRTNQLEGILDGELIITHANTSDDRSWNGYGKAAIQDGFLWNVPVFGVFSPILDGIAPGVGASRITAGSGTFEIQNSVVHTRDMQVRAPAFRLAYRGQVDLDGNLDANAEAMIFRDAWLVGKVFSLALWPVSKAFEAKISGTLDAPKTQLRYVPRFLLAPFRALNAIGNAARGKPQPENSLQDSANPSNPSTEAPKQ